MKIKNITIKHTKDANIDYWYFIIERTNHTTFYSNNYRSEKMAQKKLERKLKELNIEN